MRPSLPTPARPIKVMIVDDSAIIRALLNRILKTDAHIKVCGSAPNGQAAIDTVGALAPDVVILDIEMPVKDGITALPEILKAKPGVKVVICSTLSDRGAAISMKALALGATECLLKPSSPKDIQESGGFHDGLLRLVRHIGSAAVRASGPVAPQGARPTAAAGQGARAGAGAGIKKDGAFTLRPRPIRTAAPKILAIGSSTGGPNALDALLKELRGLPVPIVITQHMPPTFTRILAEHLGTSTRMSVAEGAQGAVLEPGTVTIAPGGKHMLFQRLGDRTTIALDDGPPENFCKPAVDPMLRSLKELYGPDVLTVILTGMGEDGAKGAKILADAGGAVLAQDEETSVVWGMPGATAHIGAACAVEPLPSLAQTIRGFFGGARA